MPDIYSLKMNEIVELDDTTSVRRVPNGWIYTQHEYGHADAGSMGMCFVPYSEKESKG
jgi:hypothetical protein